ncbi:hypothetical protein MNV49_001703 [Pseudohyphozyma bogoriensis]|nr:hypothetical protein MNV49_001703 [Pseudohyphozyma bogoriensis]
MATSLTTYLDDGYLPYDSPASSTSTDSGSVFAPSPSSATEVDSARPTATQPTSTTSTNSSKTKASTKEVNGVVKKSWGGSKKGRVRKHNSCEAVPSLLLSPSSTAHNNFSFQRKTQDSTTPRTPDKSQADELADLKQEITSLRQLVTLLTSTSTSSLPLDTSTFLPSAPSLNSTSNWPQYATSLSSPFGSFTSNPTGAGDTSSTPTPALSSSSTTSGIHLLSSPAAPQGSTTPSAGYTFPNVGGGAWGATTTGASAFQQNLASTTAGWGSHGGSGNAGGWAQGW